MDRRGFLGILACTGLVGLAGCTDAAPRPAPTGTGSAVPPQDDDELRQVTFTSEQELVGRYAAAILGAEPELAAQLRTLQTQHVEHAQRLRPEIPVSTEPPAPTPSVTPSPTVVPVTPSDSPSAALSVGPGEPQSSPAATPTPRPATVLAGLRRAEQAALVQRSAAADQARDAELARSLCLIAASEGQHVDVLRTWRAELTG